MKGGITMLQFTRLRLIMFSSLTTELSPFAQGRLNSIIGSRAKQSTGVSTYTTTHLNKNVNDP